MSFSVVTYNVNSLRARLESLDLFLQEYSPDVVALQETKVMDDKFPLEWFEERGYQVAFKGEKSYNGVALISKFPIEDVRTGMDGWEIPGEARLIAGTIQGIRILNTYVPQGREVDTEPWIYKLGWLKHLKKYWQSYGKPDQPWIWLGDFNVAPGDFDVHSPQKLDGSVGFHPEERAILADLLKWGWVDIFRKYRTGQDEFTFWDYRGPNGFERNLGWRIDHIWATVPLANCSKDAFCAKAYRGLEKPSDHAPVLAIFDWPANGVERMPHLVDKLSKAPLPETQGSLF